MSSLYEINSFKEVILEKEKAYEEFFKSLDEWQVELNKKIERIKRNLRSEIRILKKLFFNFNQDYMDYNYYNEFHYFFENTEYFFLNVKYLKKFTNSPNFDTKSELIFDLLSPNKKKPQEIKNKLEYVETIGRNGLLENFNDKFLLLYSEMEMKNIIKLISIDNFEEFYRINLPERIKSLSFSTDNKKIYSCLSSKKSVLIINYDSEKNTLKLSDEKIEIKDGLYKNFWKCIPINDNKIITIDKDSIYLWNKKYLNQNNFLNSQKKDLFCSNLYDACQINDECLLFSHCESLTFLTIENLEVEKNIKDIDCNSNKEKKSLILIKDCVLVNCSKGIAIISIKTKEMIQYIQNWENFDSKEIVKSSNNYIYISNSLNDLFGFNFLEYDLKLVEKTKINDPYGEIISSHKYSYDDYDDYIDSYDDVFHLNKYNIIINGDYMFIWDHSVYRSVFDK